MCFRAFGGWPPIVVLVLGYLIGQPGGNLALPRRAGRLEGGHVGTFALYHQPVAQAIAVVLVYHEISPWVRALLGSAAFLTLRSTLAREHRPGRDLRDAARANPTLAQPVPPR